MPSGASVFHKHFVTKLNVKCNITDMHQSHSSVHTNNLAKTLWHYHALVSVAWMTPNGTARHLSVCLSIPVHLSKSAMWWVELVCCLTSHSTIFQLHVYMWRHRCAGELKKKLDLQSGSQCHRHFVGFLMCPSKHRHGANIFMVIRRNRHISVAFYDAHGDTEYLFSPLRREYPPILTSGEMLSHPWGWDKPIPEVIHLWRHRTSTPKQSRKVASRVRFRQILHIFR